MPCYRGSAYAQPTSLRLEDPFRLPDTPRLSDALRLSHALRLSIPRTKA